MSDQDTGDDATDDEEEWRFPLSDFEDDDGEAGADDPVDPTVDDPAVVVDPAGTGEQAGPDEDAGPAEAASTRETIEAGEPTLEGVFFLLLGVAFTLFVISRLVVG